MEERYDFDEAAMLSPFAVGAPGKRTFFLAIGQKQNWIRAWLEKDQLEALATAIEQFLYTVSQDHPNLLRGIPRASAPDAAPTGLPTAELQVEDMTLGFDDGKAELKLTAHPMGPQEEQEVELNCRATLPQIKRLGERAASVCAAGRPRCPLCSGPIEPSGHVCPRYN